MKAYHGTNQNFKKLDVDKTSEFGLYLTTDKKVALSYGSKLHEVELHAKNLINLSTKTGIKRALNLFPVTAQIIIEEENLDDDLTVDEIIKDEFEACISCLSDSSINLDSGKNLRDELLRQLYATGYDCIKFQDYTDGDYHDAYIIFDNSSILQ